MPRIDLAAIPRTNATGYPAPYDAAVAGRHYRRLAPASGLAILGASHVELEPGAWSSQRHWHRGEDELVVMLAGEAVLVEDGHHLQNRSGAPCTFVAISAGDRASGGDYPDIDMYFEGDGYFRNDGTPYDAKRAR